MITHATKPGLIVSAARRPLGAFDELIDYCGWPVLLAATPRRLRRELLLGVPSVSLFWLDDARDLVAVVELLRWLRGYRPAVRRFVMAYRPDAQVEPAVRGANVHFFAAVERDIRNLLESPALEWLPAAHGSPPATAAMPLESFIDADRAAARGAT